MHNRRRLKTKELDLKRENARLKRRLQALTEEAAKNEAILRRSQKREMQLLEVEDLDDLLQLLVEGLVDEYDLAAVGLLLCDPQHEIRHILIGGGTLPDDVKGVRFLDSMAGVSPHFDDFDIPWLGPYNATDHAPLFPAATTIRSVALLPLWRHNTLIGSLNFGSEDVSRFTRDHATDFLQHLGTIVSFCLENTVNRARLIRSGLTDVLTGWHNRRYLEDRLREELARSQRKQQPLVCLLMDVDNFKQINDSHGHLAGDVVLREVAARIESQVRASDVTARFGGDEFAVLLPGATVEESLRLSERIRRSVCGAPIESKTTPGITVTLSIGIASATPNSDSRELGSLGQALLSRADAALYEAKSAGRNRVRLSD